MSAFSWNDCFVTGLADVDAQHRRLVELINRFGELVMRPEGASGAELDSVFGDLANYASYHFVEEEALMQQVGVAHRHVEEHRQSHGRFLDEVTRLHAAVGTGKAGAASDLLRFLSHWLAYHILGTDQFMARQIAAIRAGCPAADAYQANNLAADRATEALLTALDGLFQQVSDRNRELEEANRMLEARVAERTQALTEANQRLDDLANTDPLSGLPNRRYALWRFALEWTSALREDRPLACMMIDADNFKQINDSHGHDAGDAVLRALSVRLSAAVRTDDIVCRLGGDEFLVICPATPLGGALALAEKIRAEVASLRVPAGSGEWCGSVSIGVAARAPAMNSLEDLIKAADRGVYLAKAQGRNRVAHSA